jgi:molybdate transport system substrate-binding protein
MQVLKVLSAGAAETLLRTLGPQFETANACHVESEFGNAGVIAGKLRAQQASDLVILPEKPIAEFGRSAIILTDTIAGLGKVGTALAVPGGQLVPSLEGVDALRRALLNAAHLYAPEWRNATAGIHFKNVLESLGIWSDVEQRLKSFPNGAASMKALACASQSSIGCTQATEIFGERGVTFAGYLPDEFKLETMYSAGVCESAADETLARKFVAFITGEASRGSRAAAGFL